MLKQAEILDSFAASSSPDPISQQGSSHTIMSPTTSATVNAFTNAGGGGHNNNDDNEDDDNSIDYNSYVRYSENATAIANATTTTTTTAATNSSGESKLIVFKQFTEVSPIKGLVAGFMNKFSVGGAGGDTFRRRWFELYPNSNSLLYSRSPGSLVRGSISLLGASIKPGDIPDQPFVFILFTPHAYKSSWTLQASSDTEIQRWVRAIILVAAVAAEKEAMGLSSVTKKDSERIVWTGDDNIIVDGTPMRAPPGINPRSSSVGNEPDSECSIS
jgi:hypothetical protein